MSHPLLTEGLQVIFLGVHMTKRISVTVIVFFATLVAANYIIGELAVLYEMWATGAKTRADLADDFGLGIIGMLIVFPSSVVIAVICSWFVWRKTRRRVEKN